MQAKRQRAEGVTIGASAKLSSRASVDTSKPAIDRHFKTGHHAGELRLG